MSRLFLSLALLMGLLLLQQPAQAQSGARSRNVKRGSTAELARAEQGHKLAPGVRMGAPLPLTTDYMGRPLKKKEPAKKPVQTASSLSKGTSSTSEATTPATESKTKVKAKSKRR
jgi:hypothetical protein